MYLSNSVQAVQLVQVFMDRWRGKYFRHKFLFLSRERNNQWVVGRLNCCPLQYRRKYLGSMLLAFQFDLYFLIITAFVVHIFFGLAMTMTVSRPGKFYRFQLSATKVEMHRHPERGTAIAGKQEYDE